MTKREPAAGWILLLLTALNVWLAWRLFKTSYIDNLYSIEAVHIALPHWIARHWNDLGWYPLWFSGMPLQSTYQLGLPVLCAGLMEGTGWDAGRAYHFMTGVLYVLGPPGLFLLVRQLGGSWLAAAMGGWFWSLLSFSGLLVEPIGRDMGSVWYLRRLQAMIFYGEGPNSGGMSLLPWALAALHWAVERPGVASCGVAAMTSAALVMVSIPAGVAFALCAAAYWLARDGGIRERVKDLAVMALAGASGYALIAPWFLPSTFADYQRNAQILGGDYRMTPVRMAAWAGFAALWLALRWLLHRAGANLAVRWAVLAFAPLGFVTLLAFWAKFYVLPQPERFHIAMEVPLCAAAGLACGWLCGRGVASIRWGLAVLLVAFSVHQAIEVRYQMRKLTPKLERSSLEKDFAGRLNEHPPRARVYAAGSASFWLNAWSDAPQARGCCMHGVPNPMAWISSYILPSADGAGDRYAEIALLWLKALGAETVLVGGPRTADAFQDWRRPDVLKAALAAEWKRGDDWLLRVPLRNKSLAHVVPDSARMKRAPENGIDVEPLQGYVAALDAEPEGAASFVWLRPSAGRIWAKVGPGDVVSWQVTWHPGWRAQADGRPVALERDALGHMTLRPEPGDRTIEVSFDGGPELGWANAVRALVLAGFAGALVYRGVKRNSPIATSSLP
jgi:hypothetical protein